MPYPKSEYPLSRDYICDGFHGSTTIKYAGPLEIEICRDPTCARVTARCEHQVETDRKTRGGIPVYVESICEWDDEGLVLSCTYCGKDCT